MKLIKTFLAVTALLFISATQVKADNIQEADKVVKTTVNSVLDSLKTGKVDDVKRLTIVQEVNKTFDFALMSRLALRSNYKKLSKENRAKYTSLFVTQLQDSYLDKLELYSDEKVIFESAYAQKNKVVVPTKLLSKGETIGIDYKLYKNKAGSWKVYDVVVEKVSLVQTYRSQYTSFLKTGTIEELFVKMTEKK